MSKKILRSEKQKRQHETYLRLKTEQASTSVQHIDDTQTDLDSDDSSSIDLLTDDLDKMIDDVSGGEHQVTKQSQMRLTLSNVARECDRQTDRHGVSDRCAASLVSAVLEDVGLIHDQDSSMVIDRSKIRRECERVRKELQSNLSNSVSGLYFDGRKDTQVKKGTKYYAKTITEEHVTLVHEPKCVYIGHITPSS